LHVDWREFDVSLLSTFPHLGFRVEGLSLTGAGAFEADTLLSVGRFEAGLGLFSVVRNLRSGGKIEVRSVEIEKPRISLRVLEDGTASWEAVKPAGKPVAEEATEPAAEAREGEAGFGIGIRSYRIEDAAITYDDRQGDVALSLTGFTHEGSGDFSGDSFMMRTSSHADRVSLSYGGIPYLPGVTLDAKVALKAERMSDFLFEENEIRLNALSLSLQGRIRKEERGYALDLTFRSPGTEFSEILSLIPSVYKKDFAQLESAGRLSLSGNVRGLYSGDRLPAFSLALRVDGGRFTHPGSPVPVENVAIDLLVTNPGGTFDNTVVQMKKFHAELGGEPFDATLLLKTPVSDPYVEADLEGRIDLARARQAIPADDAGELRGAVRADVSVKGRMSSLKKKELEKFAAAGTLEVRDFAYTSAERPKPLELGVTRMHLAFSPEYVHLEESGGRLGRSDFAASGTLENFFSFLLEDEPLTGALEVTSRNIDLDELMAAGGGEETPADTAAAPASLGIPGGIDFSLRAAAQRVRYRGLDLEDVKGNLRVKEKTVVLEGLSMKTLGGSITMNGTYDARVDTMPRADIRVGMSHMDIQKAAKAFLTVRTLAPVAEYATGLFSLDAQMKGKFTADMIPAYETLNGEGTIRLSDARLEDFKPLEVIARELNLDFLRTLEIGDLTQRFALADGRFSVSEFQVSANGSRMAISGSHGLDHSLDYLIKMAIPREVLGTQANRFLEGLLSKASAQGIDYEPGDVIRFGVRLGGTFEKPSFSTDLGGQAGTLARDLMEKVKEKVETEKEELLQEAGEKGEEAADAGRAELERKKQEAEKILKEAEARAESIRSEARRSAERVRSEGYARARQVESGRDDPVSRQAAKVTADRIRKESDARAQQILSEADTRARLIMEEARKEANAILGG
jgi:hypothetical protein